MSTNENTRRRGRPPAGNRQGDRSCTVVVLLKPQAKALLTAAAGDQFRAVSGQAAKYVIDGLIRDGYITPSRTESPSFDLDGDAPKHADDIDLPGGRTRPPDVSRRPFSKQHP